MAKAWCYQCEKNIEPTEDGLCPDCGGDFIEYMNEDDEAEEPVQARPAPPQPAPQPQPRVTIRQMRITPNGIFENIFNNVLGGANGLQNMFHSIVNGVLNPILGGAFPTDNGDGHQQGDYFFGNEEQLQALAERLFRMNSGSLGSPPVSESFKENLKPVKYEEGCTVEDTCSICLEQFQNGDDVVILPCKHGFHPDCIDPWLKMHSECPSCRHKLPAQE